jgi:hypothetical protein
MERTAATLIFQAVVSVSNPSHPVLAPSSFSFTSGFAWICPLQPAVGDSVPRVEKVRALNGLVANGVLLKEERGINDYIPYI